jgi:twinkle protein
MLVSHLRRVQGNEGHENGIEVNLSHLRGSQSIAQLSDCVIALERNQQALDEVEANTTKLRVLKSRYTGDVGLATQVVYDRDTGRLSELAATQDNLEFDKDLPF